MVLAELRADHDVDADAAADLARERRGLALVGLDPAAGELPEAAGARRWRCAG